MILAESYTSNWINSHRAKKGFEKINPPLAEKMIHALGLVEALAGQKEGNWKKRFIKFVAEHLLSGSN